MILLQKLPSCASYFWFQTLVLHIIFYIFRHAVIEKKRTVLAVGAVTTVVSQAICLVIAQMVGQTDVVAVAEVVLVTTAASQDTSRAMLLTNVNSVVDVSYVQFLYKYCLLPV